MAGSLNRVTLIGNCGADPEIHTTADGRKLARLRLATSESWRDKTTGERKKRTEWHTVVIFSDGIAGVVDKYVKKGSKVCVEGQLQTRDYEDREGVKRYATEVVITAFRGTLVLLGDASGRPPPNEADYGRTRTRDPAPPARTAPPAAGPPPSYASDPDDEIPF